MPAFLLVSGTDPQPIIWEGGEIMGELIAGLILLGVAAYIVYLIVVGLIWLAIHVVPWILLFVVPAALLFLYLKSERVQLTSRSTLAVFLGCGAVSWLATLIVVSETGLSCLFALSLGPAFFFTSALLLLNAWVVFRWMAAWSQMREALREAEIARNAAAERERIAGQLRARARGIEFQEGETSANCDRVAKNIAQLCAAEPRSLGLLAANLTEEARSMSGEAIDAALAELHPSSGRVASRLRVLVLERELASRSAEDPASRLSSCQASLIEAERELARARARIQKAQARVQHQTEFYKAIRNGPVVL